MWITLSHHCTANLVVSGCLCLIIWRARYNVLVKWEWRTMWDLHASFAQNMSGNYLVKQWYCQFAFMLVYIKAFGFGTPSSLSSGFSINTTVLNVFPASYLKCQSFCLISDPEVKGSVSSMKSGCSCAVGLLTCSESLDFCDLRAVVMQSSSCLSWRVVVPPSSLLLEAFLCLLW